MFYVNLSDNQLIGEIPVELGNMTKLSRLQLHQNRLTGQIPPELGDPAHLNTLRLAGNNFSGCVPPQLTGIEDNDLGSLDLPPCAP